MTDMICSACGHVIDRTDHVIFIDGEALCRATIEEDYGSVAAYLEHCRERDTQ